MQFFLTFQNINSQSNALLCCFRIFVTHAAHVLKFVETPEHTEPGRCEEEGYARFIVERQRDEHKRIECENQVVDNRIQWHFKGMFSRFFRFLTTIFHMAYSNDAPDENEAECGHAGDQYEYAFRHYILHDNGHEDNQRGENNRIHRHLVGAQAEHTAWCIAFTSQGVHHAACTENTAVTS